MKNIHIYILYVVFAIACLSSCSDKSSIDCSASIVVIQNQLKEHALLKAAVLKGDKWILSFENGDVAIDANTVQSLDFDTDDSWTSYMTFIDGSTYKIPTIGTSIDRFITEVKANPSTYNPNAARVVVDLPALGYMKIIVHSKPGSVTPDITYSFKSVDKAQILPIFGLYLNYNNDVTLIYTDQEGNERARSEIKIQTMDLKHPYKPSSITVFKQNIEEMEPGMTLVNSPGQDETDTSLPYMIDADGEIRWSCDWQKHPDLQWIGFNCGLIRLKNGNFLTGDATHNTLVELDMFGEIVKKWDLMAMGYNFHHAVSETDEGNVMICVTKISAKLKNGNPRINDFILEFNPQKSEILKEWDLTAVLDSTRYGMTTGFEGSKFEHTATNWCHNNGVLKLKENDYLATARYQGIFKYTSGGLKWIISPHKYWQGKFRNALLKPLHKDGTPITDQDVIDGIKGCDDFDWPWGVHCAVMLPNGHYLAFDNGYGRYYSILPPTGEQLFSRAVEYEVDEENHTVRQVWQYGKELGKSFYAAARSSIQYLPKTGNYLIGSAMNNLFVNGKYGAHIVEVNPVTQEVVYDVGLESAIFQRVIRMPLYPEGL